MLRLNYDYPSERFVNTGLQFCGLIMGDHSKCGINTMFNTGTVVGGVLMFSVWFLALFFLSLGAVHRLYDISLK